MSASADDLSIPEEMVKDVIEESQETIASGVIVRYARNWQVLPPTETLTQPDALLRELRREWRRVEAGDMSSAGVYESSLLQQSDAKRQAEALLQIQQGRIFRIDLYDPVPDSLIHQGLDGGPPSIGIKTPCFLPDARVLSSACVQVYRA